MNKEAIYFINACNAIKTIFNVKFGDIAKVLQSYPTVLSELQQGKTSVKEYWKDRLAEKYHVRPEYLKFGEYPIFKNGADGYVSEDNNIIIVLRKQIEQLEKDKEFLQSLVREVRST